MSSGDGRIVVGSRPLRSVHVLYICRIGLRKELNLIDGDMLRRLAVGGSVIGARDIGRGLTLW